MCSFGLSKWKKLRQQNKFWHTDRSVALRACQAPSHSRTLEPCRRDVTSSRVEEASEHCRAAALGSWTSPGPVEENELAVGQNQWYHFGVGEFTTHFRTYFSGWIGMFTGGYDLAFDPWPHSHIPR